MRLEMKSGLHQTDNWISCYTSHSSSISSFQFNSLYNTLSWSQHTKRLALRGPWPLETSETIEIWFKLEYHQSCRMAQMAWLMDKLWKLQNRRRVSWKRSLLEPLLTCHHMQEISLPRRSKRVKLARLNFLGRVYSVEKILMISWTKMKIQRKQVLKITALRMKQRRTRKWIDWRWRCLTC